MAAMKMLDQILLTEQNELLQLRAAELGSSTRRVVLGKAEGEC
jgi:hypothetical protein